MRKSRFLFLFILLLSALNANERGDFLKRGDYKKIIDSLSVEEKVGQLFYLFFYGDHLNEEAKKLLRDSSAGNVIYYTWANELSSMSRVRALSSAIQEEMEKSIGLPALISIDQEGGRVTRLVGEFTQFPSARAMSEASGCRVDLIEEIAFTMGQEMHAVGINLDFAPVVDINNEPKNPIIGTRSFASDALTVTAHAAAFIRGLHRANVFATLKHFPGHGNTKSDSHLTLPTLFLSREELFDNELKPFIALKDSVECIMMGHILLPNIDSEPASISPYWISLLRDTIGFEGLIVSDSLVMRGITGEQSTFEATVEAVSEAAIEAFLAGTDQLILGRLEWASFEQPLAPELNYRLMRKVLQRFCGAVYEGRISEERIDESLMRIFALKARVLAIPPT